MKDKRVVAVVGPTAVGKTAFSIDLAKEFNGEIISCDSMQIYEYMDIGSAKPSKEELSIVPHHMIGVIDPKDSFSAAKYRELALKDIETVFNLGKLPFIVGGTGLYLDALIYDMDFASSPSQDLSYRESLYEMAEESGPEALFQKLKEIHPEAAERIHPNNIKRVVRAIEAAEKGKGISDFSGERKDNPDLNPLIMGITMDRDILYDRIDKRVDILMDLGLKDEVETLMNMGLDESFYSMQGIGYKELIAFFKGEYDLDRAVELIKRNSRHYAKRQLTWFKRYENIRWFNLSEYRDRDETLGDMIKWLKNEL